MVRIAAVIDALDDADLLEPCIEHLRRIGVETITVVAGAPADPAHEMAAAVEAGERVRVVHPADVDSWRERAARVWHAGESAGSAGADWVLFLQPDEHWLPVTGDLRTIGDLEGADVLSVMRYAVVAGPMGPILPSSLTPEAYGETLVYARPFPNVQRHLLRHPEAAWIRGLLEPSVMVRPGALATLHADGRSPEAAPDGPLRRAIAGEVVVASVLVRTLRRAERRARHATSALSGDPGLRDDPMAWPSVRLADAREEGRLRSEVERQLVGEADLDDLRKRGDVRSVADLFAHLIPPFSSEEEYLAAVRAAQPWLSVAGLICRREGIGPLGPLKHTAGHRPSVIVPPDHVVKLFSPWKDGSSVLARELAALDIVARDPGLAVPRVVARGSIDDDWRYIVLRRLPGMPLSHVSAGYHPPEVVDTAAWLGRFVNRLHRVPLTEEERESGWQAFSREVRARHESADLIMRDRRGLPERLIPLVRDWMPPLERFLGSPGDMVLTHADLNEDHVIGSLEEGSFRPSGVIDFGEAVIAHPMYDLGPIWWSVMQADRRPLAAFLGHAGLPGLDSPDFPRLALAWAMIHPCWNVIRPKGIDEVADLDDLALRCFGPPPGGWEPGPAPGRGAAGASPSGSRLRP